MRLFEAMHAGFELNVYLEFLLRLLLASVCGYVIGIERARRFKDAGVRTHFLVAFSAALLMIISKYAFIDLNNGAAAYYGVGTADPARIAAQVVSGVSFLGVGIIYRDKHHAAKGLTTAAGIWAAAGVGLAIGAGMYFLGLSATVIVVILQFALHRFAIGNDRYTTAEIRVVLHNDPDAVNRLHRQLDEWRILVVGSNITREEDTVKLELKVKVPSSDLQDDISAFTAGDPSIRSFKFEDWG